MPAGTLPPGFQNPPVFETILGLQFERIRGFRSNHYGSYWHQYLKPNGFGKVTDETALPTFVEQFDVPKLDLIKATEARETSEVRMKARNQDGTRTVQLQPDKLYLSWNRLTSQTPRYSVVKTEFEALVNDLNKFAEVENLGPLQPNLWEIHYINQIRSGTLWQEPKDWHQVLPMLFPLETASISGLRQASFSGEWHFEIEPKKGRVHVKVAKMVTNQSTEPILYFSLLARGEIGPTGSPDFKEGMDLGHEACMKLFHGLTSEAAHQEWGVIS
jgi:uncharacterized protein (TIGR04255 family)